MALDEDMKQDDNALSDDEEQDLDIAVNLAKQLIDKGGQQVIAGALQSKDPGSVLGQFLMQLGMQIFQNMPKGMELSPRMMLAHGGWLEQISDYLQEDYDVPREAADRAEMFVAAQGAQMAQSQLQQQGATPQQAGAQPAPAMPQGGGLQ